MAQTVELIAKNIKRLREIKHLSQKGSMCRFGCSAMTIQPY